VASCSNLEESPILEGEYQKNVANSDAEEKGVKANAESKSGCGWEHRPNSKCPNA
jgi:hypothetical protein